MSNGCMADVAMAVATPPAIRCSARLRPSDRGEVMALRMDRRPGRGEWIVMAVAMWQRMMEMWDG